ncbi:hypothetical protein AB4865_06665 [Capnocytophaga sp. ARDL2]|uniref:hypothetical protein n=1 Tax=Capnocytophaga sp. ARDL2 TaxID=3238809 RepID=UPI0035561D1B
MNKILVPLILLSCFSSCKNDNKIIGLYKMDKYVILNKENDIKDYHFLELNSNGVFNVFHSRTDSTNQIQGKWKCLSKAKNNELLVQFEYEGKTIVGNLRGNIFYFIEPNDFHNNKYKSILYVKSLEL